MSTNGGRLLVTSERPRGVKFYHKSLLTSQLVELRTSVPPSLHNGDRIVTGSHWLVIPTSDVMGWLSIINDQKVSGPSGESGQCCHTGEHLAGPNTGFTFNFTSENSSCPEADSERIFLFLSKLHSRTPYWQVNRSSASQGIPCFVCNPKVHHRIHNSPPLLPILSHIDTVHAPIPFPKNPF